MALRLQFLTVVVPRARFAQCRDLPEWMGHLGTGGFFFDTAWYDGHLWCETAMDGQAAEDILQAWEARGLRRHDAGGTWADLCLAASHRGPLGPCPWLAHDAESNAVWLVGTEPGPVVGGLAQQHALETSLTEEERRGEASYSRMYEARRPKDDFEDATLALGQALTAAQFLHRVEDARRLEARLDHMRAVYAAQFRSW